VPAVALAIGAHPDDVEFGCGGTIAKWAAQGCVVHHLVCTDGSKGTWDPHADTAALVVTRQREQRAAAAALGATGQVVFLGWPDGELDSGLRQRWEVAYWIRRLTPDVVLGHDPWKRYRLHPDHRHAGQLACDGIVAARDPHFFPEQQLAHHRPSTLLLWEADAPDHAEDVTASLATKLAALEAHASQFESTMKATDDDALVAFRARVTARLAGLGEPHGFTAAEVFKKIANL
jgi:LmbE family N-acetylglucosaminyl deacetylase